MSCIKYVHGYKFLKMVLDRLKEEQSWVAEIAKSATGGLPVAGKLTRPLSKSTILEAV